jgi:hypothetical protein
METLENVRLLFLAGYCSNGWRSSLARRRKFADGCKVTAVARGSAGKGRSSLPKQKTAASFSLTAECYLPVAV